jgi:hypothetical protein
MHQTQRTQVKAPGTQKRHLDTWTPINAYAHSLKVSPISSSKAPVVRCSLNHFPGSSTSGLSESPHLSRGRHDSKEAPGSSESLACSFQKSTAFTGIAALEEFAIGRDWNTLQLPLSALDTIAANHPNWSSSLQRLQLELENDLKEGGSQHLQGQIHLANASPEALTFNIILVSSFFRRLTVLVDLQMAPRKAPASYFKQLSVAMPVMALQRLKLSHVTTRHKYLVTFLRSYKDTLRSITLDHITLTDNGTINK